MAKVPTNKSLAKSIFVFGGIQILSVLAALARSKVAAHTIGAMGMGLSALYLGIAGLVTNVCNLGLPDSGVQTLSNAYAEGNLTRLNRSVGILRLWGIITAAAAMVITIVFSPLLCYIYFRDPTSHLHSVLLLSVVPACSILSAIEMVVLKSLQRRKLLSECIAASAVITVAVSVPFYYFMGWNGIIFSIVLTSVIILAVTMAMSYHVNATRPAIDLVRTKEGGIRNSVRNLWHESSAMVMLGLSLVITGVGSMGMDLLLQTYFTTISTLAVLGLYKAGFQLSITYPSMIFTAVNNDYYPRLTTLANDVNTRNALIRKQTLMLLVIVTPCIAAFIALLPWIVPLILSDEFIEIVPMVSIGALSVVVKCVALPLCFVPLALGKKRDFVQMELISNVGMIVCVIGGCHVANLTGVGAGFVMSNILDFVYAYILCRCKYGFRYKI